VKVRESNCRADKLRVQPPTYSPPRGSQSPDDNQRKVMTVRKVHAENFRIRTAFELGPAGMAQYINITIKYTIYIIKQKHIKYDLVF
jgi:hypothetical protein